jgi:hypothetical protein
MWKAPVRRTPDSFGEATRASQQIRADMPEVMQSCTKRMALFLLLQVSRSIGLDWERIKPDAESMGFKGTLELSTRGLPCKMHLRCPL